MRFLEGSGGGILRLRYQRPVYRPESSPCSSRVQRVPYSCRRDEIAGFFCLMFHTFVHFWVILVYLLRWRQWCFSSIVFLGQIRGGECSLGRTMCLTYVSTPPSRPPQQSGAIFSACFVVYAVHSSCRCIIHVTQKLCHGCMRKRRTLVVVGVSYKSCSSFYHGCTRKRRTLEG